VAYYFELYKSRKVFTDKMCCKSVSYTCNVSNIFFIFEVLYKKKIFSNETSVSKIAEKYGKLGVILDN